MNYFPFDPDPYKAAIALDDKRLPRVFHEATMTLSVMQYRQTGIAGPYSPRVPVPRKLLDWACDDGEIWLTQWTQALLQALIERFGQTRVDGYACYERWCQLDNRYRFRLSSRPPRSFPNFAKAAIKGLDFTHIEDTHDAYRQYIIAQWKRIDVRPCVWTYHGPPLWFVAPNDLPAHIAEVIGS